MLLKGVPRTTILAAVENVEVGAIIIGPLKSKREQTRIGHFPKKPWKR